MSKIFPDPTTYNYLHKVHHPVKFYPYFIEILETRSNIWMEYASTMIRRCEMYPSVSFVFISNNQRFEIRQFFKLYPALGSAYNVVEYDSEMFKILETKQYPYCIVVTPANKVVYQGSPMATFRLQPHLHKMNIIAYQLKASSLVTIKEVGQVNPAQLSLALSGLTRGGALRNDLDDIERQIGLTRSGATLLRSDSQYLPHLQQPRCRSAHGRTDTVVSTNSQQQKCDIFYVSAPLIRKLALMGEKNSTTLINGALQNQSEEERFYRLVRMKNLGPNAEQIRRSDEGINPQLRYQRVLVNSVDAEDELAQGRRELREIERNMKKYKIQL